MAELRTMKGVSEKDRRLIEEAETLLGPEPTKMGFVKNLFWGNFRNDLVFPYPAQSAEESARCDQLLAELDDYLRTEHPAIQIDQEQEIPRWVIDRLFQIGVLGMTIPKEFGGLGLGITSYNRVLERIGHACGSTAVLVSAHQSIGCKAIMLFGTEEQKKRWLPHLAKDWLSAFCLSEPNVGCDAGGQETHCELSPDGQFYILNGEKKWATSGALSGLFTVMTKQKIKDQSGKETERVTALVCTPDMPGIDIFQKNRSKCGIRGTWQARIRFRDVRVPRENLLHKEGKGLNVALSCLNYGRCTLSAGMLGGARMVMDQGAKWSRTRYQFGRPLSDFELVKQKLARMAAYCYAMDAVLYMTTGFLDRSDEDIMLETAICKVFCSEMGWRVVNDGVQIMGGEGYMTENEVERVFRDSRINIIVEGANEVMQSFIFAYGGKQLAEKMLTIKEAVGWNRDEAAGANLARIIRNLARFPVLKASLLLGSELFLGIRRPAPAINGLLPELEPQARRLSILVREHAHQFKQASRRYDAAIVHRQAVQARLADNAMWLHAFACTLSKLDRDLRQSGTGFQPVSSSPALRAGGTRFQPVSSSQHSALSTQHSIDPELARDRTAAAHFFDLAEQAIHTNFRELYENPDDSMLAAAEAAIAYTDTIPNGEFAIPEKSPVAKGSGRPLKQDGIKQFPGDKQVGERLQGVQR